MPRPNLSVYKYKTIALMLLCHEISLIYIILIVTKYILHKYPLFSYFLFFLGDGLWEENVLQIYGHDTTL